MSQQLLANAGDAGLEAVRAQLKAEDVNAELEACVVLVQVKGGQVGVAVDVMSNRRGLVPLMLSEACIGCAQEEGYAVIEPRRPAYATRALTAFVLLVGCFDAGRHNAIIAALCLLVISVMALLDMLRG